MRLSATRVVKQTSKRLINLTLAGVVGFSGLAVAAPLFLSSTAYAATLSVCSSGCTYSTIQSAINAAANSGDTINVGSGTYTENLIVNKSVDLEGPNSGIATINGGSGFAITLESPNVTINGFTITASSSGEGIYNIDAQTPGHDISGVTITNNIFSGSSRAVALESNATGTVKVNNNKFDSNDKDLAVADNSFGDLQVEGNTFNQPSTNDTGVQMGPDGTGTFNSFEFQNNQVAGNVNIGANVKNATVSGNTFNPGSVVGGSLEFQAALHNSTVSDNTFNGNSSYACFQLFGSQYGLVPSDTVTVSGNTFTNCGYSSAPYSYAFQLSQDVNHINFKNNTISGAYDSIATRTGSGWTLNSDIHINNNTITGSRDLDVSNTVSGTLDATLNYWGGGAPNTSGSVTTTPYFTNSAMTTKSDATVTPDTSGNATATNSNPTVVVSSSTSPVNVTVSSGTTDATIDFSALQSGSSATLPQTTVTTQNANVQIQSGTTVTATGGTWDGKITLPTVQTNANISIPTPSGTSTTVGTVIEVGSDSVSLTFDKPVRLLISGQVGKLVGFERNGTFTQINTVCTADSASTALSANGDCYINVGNDMVVWTKHFTQFVTYVRNNTYTVQPGDTFYSIAAKVGLTLAQLEALNPTAGHPAGNFAFILPGDVLSIGSASVTTASAPVAAGSAGGSTPNTTGQISTPASTKSAVKSATTGTTASKATGLKWYWWLTIAAVTIIAVAGLSAFNYKANPKKK